MTRLLTFLEVSCLPVNVFFSKFVPFFFFLTSSKFTLSFCLEESMYLSTMQVASVCVCVFVCVCVCMSVCVIFCLNIRRNAKHTHTHTHTHVCLVLDLVGWSFSYGGMK